jgi:hypothetical protein
MCILFHSHMLTVCTLLCCVHSKCAMPAMETLDACRAATDSTHLAHWRRKLLALDAMSALPLKPQLQTPRLTAQVGVDFVPAASSQQPAASATQSRCLGSHDDLHDLSILWPFLLLSVCATGYASLSTGVKCDICDVGYWSLDDALSWTDNPCTACPGNSTTTASNTKATTEEGACGEDVSEPPGDPLPGSVC